MANFPNVPNVPGVPPVPRDLNAAASPLPTLMTADSYVGYGSVISPSWGIISNGVTIVTADTVVGVEFKQEWAIADYPVERGGFESYDKVDIPYQPKVVFASGGTETRRQALLDSISAAANARDSSGKPQLYDVATPEELYSSVNIQHYDYRREAKNGVGMIVVDVWLIEVREQGITSQQNAQTPSGNATIQNGRVSAWPNVSATQESIQTIAATAQGTDAFSLAQFPQSPSPSGSVQTNLVTGPMGW